MREARPGAARPRARRRAARGPGTARALALSLGSVGPPLECALPRPVPALSDRATARRTPAARGGMVGEMRPPRMGGAVENHDEI